jgi:Spy/CpxP family protein refolding chaperone
MNRFRYLAIGILLMLALAASAQQTATAPTDKSEPSPQAGMSNVDQHVKMLAEKLNLSADQQTKLKPIIQQFLDGRQKAMEDKSLSPEARHERINKLHAEAKEQARAVLTDDQQKKLDELDQQPHQPSTR